MVTQPNDERFVEVCLVGFSLRTFTNKPFFGSLILSFIEAIGLRMICRCYLLPYTVTLNKLLPTSLTTCLLLSFICIFMHLRQHMISKKKCTIAGVVLIHNRLCQWSFCKVVYTGYYMPKSVDFKEIILCLHQLVA